MTGLPNFPSYVSGHSVFSAAAADVLSSLFPSGATYFQAQAAGSRHVPPLRRHPLPLRHHRRHEPSGHRIAEYTVRFAKTDGANSNPIDLVPCAGKFSKPLPAPAYT